MDRSRQLQPCRIEARRRCPAASTVVAASLEDMRRAAHEVMLRVIGACVVCDGLVQGVPDPSAEIGVTLLTSHSPDCPNRHQR